MTIQEARAYAREMLAATSDAADLDADWLLLHSLGTSDTSFLALEATSLLLPDQVEQFKKLVRERASGIPLAYVTGEAHFFGRVFAVTPEVLIPRPTTEDLVSRSRAVISHVRQKTGKPLTMADVGTGSGCVAITLLLECPAEVGHVIATDISPAALAVARRNAKHYGLDSKMTFLQGNMLEPLSGREIDLLVSNPPYVPTAELDAPPTVETAGLRFEPRQALDGGEDGLVYVKTLQASRTPAVIETLQGEIITSGI